MNTNIDWQAADRWLMGEAWTGSQIAGHARILCEEIGPRWASSPAERQTVEYLRDQLSQAGLDRADIEEFELSTWEHGHVAVRLEEEKGQFSAQPFNFCPPCRLEAPIVDAGYGTQRELGELGQRLKGAAAVMALGFEPFTEPEPLGQRIAALAAAGAAAVLVVDRKDGGRREYHNAGDWRDPQPEPTPLPALTLSREEGDYLRRQQGALLVIEVESRFFQAPAANVHAELQGALWPDECLHIGGHHDTVYGAPGGNDNASGTIAAIETARVLAGLRQATGIAPGRSIHFATYSAEEQKFQGSYEYVRRHYTNGNTPRLALNLDELSAGQIKGVVLAFPHLRGLVQEQLDHMGDGLRCHVMAQLDATSDHFPFLRAGFDAAHLWRWRFRGRHADSDFHHEAGDTLDKLNVRDLKEYVGQLARLFLRLSHLPPAQWPSNPLTQTAITQRLEAERGRVVRVY
jgi:aminopeptidase YwaD